LRYVSKRTRREKSRKRVLVQSKSVKEEEALGMRAEGEVTI